MTGNKRTNVTIFLTLIIMAGVLLPLYGYKFEFVTVTDVVKKVRKTFGKLESYQASFKIVSKKMGKTKVQTGTLKYKAHNKLLMIFKSPSGQRIISNGKMMWIYIPSMNVVAEQDLKSRAGMFTNTRSGLRRLFSKYHYRFAGKEQPEKQKDGSSCYTLLLRQKESRSGYRKLKLWITEDYFIKRAVGQSSSGKEVDISLKNIKTNIDMPDGLFKFNMPARARVIKNPMVAEE